MPHRSEDYITACQIRRVLLNTAADVMTYTSWSDEFAVSEMRKAPSGILASGQFARIDPTRLMSHEMDDLGFGTWSKKDPMRLIPLWLLPFLVPSFEGKSINDKEMRTLRRKDLDDDSRFGCLAYGVIPATPDPS